LNVVTIIQNMTCNRNVTFKGLSITLK
jgi:hypothetical protein